MMVKFLDTNVILRFLTQDNAAQSAAVAPLFERLARGAETVTTSESVLVEVVQVLSSKVLYALPRAEVRRHLLAILALKGLRFPAKSVFRRALELFAGTSVDFVDALLVAQMERAKIDILISFDRDFDRIASVRREEPALASP